MTTAQPLIIIHHKKGREIYAVEKYSNTVGRGYTALSLGDVFSNSHSV
jgi:hypothetical protein